MPQPEKLKDVVGDGLARTNMWASWERREGELKLAAGSSVTLTCNQDKKTIKKAQALAGALSLNGLRDMIRLLPEGVRNVFENEL